MLIQAASVGHPPAVACWFEYADPEHEYAEWENTFTWLLPEVPPHVKNFYSAEPGLIGANFGHYRSLSSNRQASLLRSMERFRQSQCRRDALDRALDLALAYEIAVSEKGDNAPPGWKVSVRSAQLIGGPLDVRQENRSAIASLYELRNQATHGGRLETRTDRRPIDEVLERTAELYVKLMQKLIALRLKPDWKAVELEPAGATRMDIDDIEPGQKYRCDYKGKQYFAVVAGKDGKNVRVNLGDIVDENGDPGDPTEALGTSGEITVTLGQLHPL